MPETRSVAYDGGRLFRVVLEPVGAGRIFEFAHHVGAVSVLPVTFDANGGASVLTINMKRLHHGVTEGDLPGGLIDGRFANPEHPAAAGLRELREETGHGFSASTIPNLDLFALHGIGTTITWDRYFAVARGVTHIGGQHDNPAEVATLCPTPLEEYADTLIDMTRNELPADVNAAFGKAGKELGREAVVGWLMGDARVPGAVQVPQSFKPWLVEA